MGALFRVILPYCYIYVHDYVFYTQNVIYTSMSIDTNKSYLPDDPYV